MKLFLKSALQSHSQLIWKFLKSFSFGQVLEDERPVEGHGKPEGVRPRHDLELLPRRDPRAAELHDQRPAGLI